MARLDPRHYTVALIAPLQIEAQAALHILENRHHGRFPVERGDDYVFKAGDVGGHNVVIATLPAGQEYGTGSAAALASQVKRSFPHLWFGLLVGVAAGLPNLSQTPPRDIRLGDVLVALSVGNNPALVAYDLGKETSDGLELLRHGHVLATTETIIRSAISSIRMDAPNEAKIFLPYYEEMKHREHANGTFIDPGQDRDRLYDLNSQGKEELIYRQPRAGSKRTRVWYGAIGSGEKLMKNARKRNQLRDRYNLIGLEMEAAGTVNHIPVGIIRGVCDYGDEHKNKDWQPYAAAMAAAYAKAVLMEIQPRESNEPGQSIAKAPPIQPFSILVSNQEEISLSSSIEKGQGYLHRDTGYGLSFVALEVAAAAVPFLDFARQLLTTRRKRRDVDTPLTKERFGQSIQHLASSIRAMGRVSLSLGVFHNGDSGEEHEAYLQCLVTECQSTAQHLYSTLVSLQRRVDKESWTGFQEAFQTVWTPGYFDEMRQNITTSRREIVVRVLACLNSEFDVSPGSPNRDFDHAERKSRRVTGVLAFHSSEIQEAILSLESGEAKTISREAGPGGRQANVPEHPVPDSIINLVDGMDDGEPEVMIKKIRSIRHAVLESLHFRQIVDRFEAVKEAHQQTFEWVFCDPKRTSKPWSDFPRWLEEGTGCYWIQGKAGSGKSTLMKFIYKDERTRKHLKKWAGGKSLTTASFFFWYLGYSIQKSQEGLLRSLLFSILKANKQLITHIMPELFVEASKEFAFEGFGTPSITELVRWYRNLGSVLGRDTSYRMCLFIDGIDEYTGDCTELLKLILNLSSAAPNIKFVLSSRPIPDCIDALDPYPGLLLQDLTRDDIQTYASDLLRDKTIIVGSEQSRHLISEVVSKSCGVFLWVAVVLRSLLRGLRDGDTLAELQERLQEIPSELGSLYQYMFSKIPSKYRGQASEMLQLLATNFGDRRGSPDGGFIQPLSALQLSYALEKSDAILEHRGLGSISITEAERKIIQIEARIRSRCLGLVELTRPVHTASSVNGIRVLYVGFIHRTVMEFLNDPEVSANMKVVTAETSFDPFLSLFCSSHWMIKMMSRCDKINRQDDIWTVSPWNNISAAVLLANSAEVHGSPIPVAHLDCLDDDLLDHWHQSSATVIKQLHRNTFDMANEWHVSHWFRAMLSENNNSYYSLPRILHHPMPRRLWALNAAQKPAWSPNSGLIFMPLVTADTIIYNKLISRDMDLGFYYLVLMCPLTSYLEAKLNRLNQSKLDFLLDFLVHKSLYLNFPLSGCGAFSVRSARAFDMLLEAGADPNQLSYSSADPSEPSSSAPAEYSIWAVFLSALVLWMDEFGRPHVFTEDELVHLERILNAFIAQGADISVKIRYGSELLTPGAIIRKILPGPLQNGLSVLDTVPKTKTSPSPKPLLSLVPTSSPSKLDDTPYSKEPRRLKSFFKRLRVFKDKNM